jgi:hypothetical protein
MTWSSHTLEIVLFDANLVAHNICYGEYFGQKMLDMRQGRSLTFQMPFLWKGVLFTAQASRAACVRGP